MPRYTVTGRYSSWRDGQRYGPWARGEQVELDADTAAWVDRDSPGTLQPVDDTPPPEPAPEPERAKVPTRDRQHRGGRNRAGK